MGDLCSIVPFFTKGLVSFVLREISSSSFSPELRNLHTGKLKVAYYSLWRSPDAFNNTITGAYCERTNVKSKPLCKTMGVCYFTMFLLEVAQNEWPSGRQRTGL